MAGLLAMSTLSAQNLVLNVNPNSGLAGTTVTVEISVENFTQILNYQGTLNWDENVLSYLSATSPAPSIFNIINPPISGGGTMPENKLAFLWSDFLTTGVDANDGEVVLSVDFQINPNAANGTITNLFIDGSETALGYSSLTTIVGPNPFPAPTVNPGTVGVGSGFPVEMLDFQATTQNEMAKLEWITASETNNDYFEIQKSENGEDFYPIGTIKGAGTTQEHTYYEFDDQITASKLFYRLKQVDFDGSSTLTDIVELSSQQAENSWLYAYPNPSQNQTHLRLKNWDELDQEFRIQLYSLDGRLQQSTLVKGNELITDYTLDVSSLARGSYLLKVNNTRGQSTQQILILE